MAYPVDILKNVDHESLELAAEEYMSQLPCRNPDTAEYLSLHDSKQIEIKPGKVSFVPLYGADTTKKLLALYSPDFTTVVGLYLLGQWWGVEDVLKTAEPSRTGLIKVSTLGERIVLYVLNRIVLRNEKSSEEVSFLCHCDHESAKILWKDGEAIGFYSYKPKGSLCRNFLTQCYQLPVMDTVFVRKCHRGKGHGVKILEDFVGSFRKEYIGLKFPLSDAMYKVCEKYFSMYPADKEILWEVEKIGSPFQRTLIANRLQKSKPKAEKDPVVSKLQFEEDDVTAPMEIEITKVQETTEYTVEIVEETITDITKEVDDIPVTRRGRSSNLKRRGIRENSEERLSTNIIRVEDIEAGVESPVEVATKEHLDDAFFVKESETVLRSTTDTVIATVTNISELRSSQKEEEQDIEKDKAKATSEETPDIHLTTAGEIKSQRGSEEECEMVNLEHNVIQETTIGSIDQSQLQTVVDIEIVKMSTGTEEEQNENLEKDKEVEEDKPVCEAEEEEIKQMLDEPEEKKAVSGTVETYNNMEALEEVTDQSDTLANKAEAESEVEEHKEKEKLTVETDSSMGAEITQVGETIYVVPEISEIDQEEAPQQSSVESAEVQTLKTTPEEDEETVENSSKMLTLNEAKVVLVDLHKLSPKEASDDNREIDIAEQDEMKHTMSSEQQAAEDIMRMEEQDGTLGTTEGYNLETDTKRTPEQSTEFKAPEGKPEPETEEVVPLSQVEKPEEKTNTEQCKKAKKQKKASTDTPSRSTSLRSTSKPIEITPVRRSRRSKALIQHVESVEPQSMPKFRTDENPERDEVIAEDVGPEDSKKANTNVDETVVIESGSSELLKATEIDTKEKTPQISVATGGDIPLVQAEPDEDVTEKVKEIKIMENEEANLAGQKDIGIEMSSLAQEKDVQEEEEAVSTERSLRRRTIRVQSPLRRKPRHVQKQDAEANVEHQGRHTVNKTESISMTEERVEEIEQEVNKMENKEANLAELEPVEEPDMIRNEDKKTSASTEENMNVCLPIITTETSSESLDDTANTNTVKTAPVDTEKSELMMGVEIDYQEKEAGPDEETEIEDGTPVIQLQKATVVLVDFSNLTRNTEEAGTPEVLKHSQMEEHLELDELDKREQELCILASEEEKQKEEIQTQEDTEMIPEDGLPQEKEKTEIVTEKVPDKVDQEVAEIDQEKAPQKSTVEATEKVIPFVEAEPEEDVVEKEGKEINNIENREINLAVKKTDEEAPEMGEEANVEQQKNEPLDNNEKETAETEKPMDIDPVVSKEQTYVLEGTTIQIEEVSQVESTGTKQSDNAKITRRSSRLSTKSVTSTQNTRKSTRLHKAELEPVKEADMSRNEYKESSATTEGTVNVCIPIITVETNLEGPDEIPNTNVEKTSAVGPETSVLLIGVETEDKKEAPKILEEVTLEAEPDEEVEKDDGTPLIQLQKATVVLVDLNKLSQSTEGESDTPEVLAHSQTEEQLELDEPDKSESQLSIQTSEHGEQQEELQKEENTEKTPEEEEDKMEEENSVEVQNKLDKQEMAFEGQKLTEVLEEQNAVKETEIVEEYKAVIDEDLEEAVTSIEHPEATSMADKTNIIKEREHDEDIALKEKQTDVDVEISNLAQEAPEAVQEILAEEVPVSTERILRRRKIQVQSPPTRKSRRVQNQDAKADVEHQERSTVVTRNKTEAVSEETVKEMDVNMKNEEASLAELEPVEEDTEKVVPLEPVIEQGFEEINKNDAASEMGRDDINLEQHENESLVKNDKETAESEKHMEMDKVPLVCKEQTYVIEETTIQVEEKVSQMESSENKSERITRSGLRISAQSATSTQKTRKSTRLHKAELEPVKEADMSRNEYKESSATTEGTVNVCMPIITVETNLEGPDEIPNTNVEKTSAVGPETSVLLICVETEDKKEAPKILEEVTLEAEPDEEVEKDDGTPLIQLQKATVVLVDLNKLSQSTEGEIDTPEVLAHSQTEEQLELDEPDKSESQLSIQTSEHGEQQELQKEENTEKTPEEEEDKMEEENSVEVQNKLDKQEMTFEGQKLTEVLEEQNAVKETEIVEECKAVIDEDLEEAVTSVEHPEATTMEDKTNIIKEREHDKDIALKEKQTDVDVEISNLAQEAPEAVQEILAEEVPVSTERILRRRKIQVQSPPRRKSRRVQNQDTKADVEHQERNTVVTRNKTEAVSEETVKEMDVNMKNEEASLAELEPVEEDTEKVVPLEPVIEQGFEEINKNDAAPEMGRDEINLEQHENESLVKNDKETAESEKHMEMDKVPLVCKEQTYVIEETTIQVEEKEKSPHLHTAELEPVKEADMTSNEGTSSMTAETVNVCVPIITAETNMESLNEDGVSMSRKVETTSYEQERDISTDMGKVDEALPDKATDEQDETKSSTETTENKIMVEMDKKLKVVEVGVQDEEKAEPPQEDKGQKQEENIPDKGEDEIRTSSVEDDATQQKEAASKEENVGETNLTNELKTTAVEGKIALESSDQETPLITRSLRYRTVTVQSTPRRRTKWLLRQEVESEKETNDNNSGNEIDSAIQESADDLNIPIEKVNEALNAEENITEFENLGTKEEGIIQVNIEENVEETGTNEDTVEEGNTILFEINESNSANPENTEQGKIQEENLEKDVQVHKEQEEKEVSCVQDEEKSLQEKENVGVVEGSSFDLVETAVERRALRKRMTAEMPTPRKSKRLRKQENDEDSEQVKEAVVGQTETVEVTFTADNIELSSEVPAAVFEGSNLGEEIQQKISEGTKSDGDCNIHEDTMTDAGEAQEEQKEKRVNKPQSDDDNKEVMEQNSKKVEETGEIEKVIEQHVETEEQKLESSTNEGFTLELELEETSDQEENKPDEENRVAMEAPKDIFTSAEKSDEGEANISEDEKRLASEKHVLQSSSSSSRRRSMRLQMYESKKNTTEDELDSEESEAQQAAKQRKRKAIIDLTPARRSKRYVRGKNV